MSALDTTTQSHRRRNPLTGQWVIVSPHRTKRPWSGATSNPAEPLPSYDEACYLCPGNERAGGTISNPEYTSTFVFENDFAALHRDLPAASDSHGLFEHEAANGECRVICFSPDHSLTLADMDLDEIGAVISLWRQQSEELESKYRWVQLFETRGEICGSSNPHPHGQLWASDFLPDEPAKELQHQADYLAQHGSHMLLDYVEQELDAGERIVSCTQDWVVLVPYWAYWPYETMVLPRTRIASLTDLTDEQQQSLAQILKSMLTGFNAIFDTPMPYYSGWHSAGPQDRDVWQLHAHYQPPLLRSAEVAKIPASYEWIAGVQRDFTPEHAADHLRSVMHWRCD